MKFFPKKEAVGISGSNYMTGLLWALETLAWDPQHLTRVAVIIADIASIDPGGNWANRPANSLSDIFLPWHVQTTASLEMRKVAIQNVLNEHPDVGWKLLLSLLPNNLFTSRPDADSRFGAITFHKIGVMVYQGKNIGTRLPLMRILWLNLARENPDRMDELIKYLPDLPITGPCDRSNPSRIGSKLLTYPEIDRLPLWERLDTLVRKHRTIRRRKMGTP